MHMDQSKYEFKSDTTRKLPKLCEKRVRIILGCAFYEFGYNVNEHPQTSHLFIVAKLATKLHVSDQVLFVTSATSWTNLSVYLLCFTFFLSLVGSLSALMISEEADGTTDTLACRFWMVSCTVILRPFQSCVAFAMSSPTFLGD